MIILTTMIIIKIIIIVMIMVLPHFMSNIEIGRHKDRNTEVGNTENRMY